MVSPHLVEAGVQVVHGGHREGEEQPAEEGPDGVLPIDDRIDGNTAVKLAHPVCEHVEATECYHHWPVFLDEFDVSDHGVDRRLKEWDQVESNHMPPHVEVFASPAKIREHVRSEAEPEDDHDKQVESSGTLS